jgi:hypothetical protein
MTVPTNEIEIRDWSSLSAGRYRFHGSDSQHGGFYADARLEYREGWRATIEGTNYAGDRDRLADSIAAFGGRM